MLPTSMISSTILKKTCTREVFKHDTITFWKRSARMYTRSLLGSCIEILVLKYITNLTGGKSQ